MGFVISNTLPAIDIALGTLMNDSLKQQFCLPGLNEFNIANPKIIPQRIYSKKCGPMLHFTTAQLTVLSTDCTKFDIMN